MTLKIPQKKMQDLVDLCKRTLTSKNITLRKLAQLIGKLRATAPAFTYAPLQVRHLQQLLIGGTRIGKSYETNILLEEKACIELRWWIENIGLQNGNPISLNPPEMVISTDAAKRASCGWGASAKASPQGDPGLEKNKNYTSMCWNC